MILSYTIPCISMEHNLCVYKKKYLLILRIPVVSPVVARRPCAAVGERRDRGYHPPL